MKTTTYSHTRLQKAIGNISGDQLGFSKKHDGTVKPLPDTSAVVVDVKRIYPSERAVEFCFPKENGEVLGPYRAWVLVDHWYKELSNVMGSMNQIKELTRNALANSGLPVPSMVRETWPYYPPTGKPVDMAQLLPLLTMLVPGLQGLAVTPLITGTLNFLMELKSIFPDLAISNALKIFGDEIIIGLKQLSELFHVITQLEEDVIVECGILTQLNVLDFLESQISTDMNRFMDFTDAERLELLIQGYDLHRLSDGELLELGVNIQKKKWGRDSSCF